MTKRAIQDFKKFATSGMGEAKSAVLGGDRANAPAPGRDSNVNNSVAQPFFVASDTHKTGLCDAPCGPGLDYYDLGVHILAGFINNALKLTVSVINNITKKRGGSHAAI